MLKRLISIFVLVIFLSYSIASALAFTQNYTPQDPGLVNQDYFDLINIKPSWSTELKVNKEVVIAVLDSGVDLDHPDLISNIWHNPGEIANNNIDDDNNSYIDDVSGWDFIDSDNLAEPDVDGEYDLVAVNHGTVVAGIIAATANNNGIVGIAPQVKIMPLRILDEQGSGNTLVLSQAIDYATENGADIINLSLVGTAYDDLLKQSIKNAYDNDVVIIAASGNEENQGLNLDLNPRYPVCELDEVNRVLGVAAVDQQKKLASYSNYGQKCIDISAPGSNFYSTVYHQADQEELNVYYSQGWSGTSVAAPVVAATAGLLKMNYPNLRPFNIYNIITDSSDSLQTADPNNYLNLGSGLINVGAALNLASTLNNWRRYIVIAPDRGQAPEITLLDEDGNFQSSFMAYAEKFTGGVNIAIGDVDSDGELDIITAPRAGGGPHVRVFDRRGNLLSQFFAYDSHFTGGVNIATGDVDNDGELDIITAPLSNGGPHIRIFDYQGRLKNQWFGFDKDFLGGVNLAVGDVNNDNQDEIIIVPADSYLSEVKVFDWRQRLHSKFIAYSDINNGVEVTVGDVNNDGWQEIITVPAKNAPSQVKLFSFKGRLKSEFLAYTNSFSAGVDMVAKDLSGDGIPEILTLPHKGSAALLKIYDQSGIEKDGFYLRDTADKTGYQLEILN